MILEFNINSKKFKINTKNSINISVPLDFYGEQPNIYGVNKASAKAVETEDFVGDTRRGGSCNFEEYKLIPHCNGTHTECIGHIAYERISVHKTLNDAFIPSILITLQPERAFETKDCYVPAKKEEDLLITEKVLKEQLNNSNNDFLEGLIIRTLPNDNSKMSRNYMNDPAPFFSKQAMELISELNVNHLLIDIPSVDRAFDEGKLSAHHIFWDVPLESHDVDIKAHSVKTITEMIYVPNEVNDGIYLLNLQITNFTADASPSRPLIFRAT